VKHREQILPFMNEVCINTRAEDRESPLLLPIQALGPVFVYARHFDVLPGPGAVDEIGSEDDLLIAGHSARGNGAGGFLQDDLLIVSVEGGNQVF